MAESNPDWIGSNAARTATGPAYQRLALPEALLLLSHDDHSGERLRFAFPDALNRAFLAGGIVDLVVRGRLCALSPSQTALAASQIPRIITLFSPIDTAPTQFAACFLRLESTESTGNSYLDRILTRFAGLAESERIHTLAGWAMLCLGKGADKRWKSTPIDQTYAVAGDLMAQGALQVEETGGFLRHGHRVRATGATDTGEDSLRLHLAETMAFGEPAMRERDCDAWTGALLCLIGALGIAESVFGRDRRETSEWRIRKFCRPESEPFSLPSRLDAYVRLGASPIDTITLYGIEPAVTSGARLSSRG